MENEVKNLGQAVETGFERVGKDIKTLSDKFDSLDKKYVTKAEFAPIQKFVYSIVGAVGLAVIGALLSLVLK